MARKLIELELYIFATTEKAIMVGLNVEDELEATWLPKRAVDPVSGHELEESDDVVPMLIPEALAIQKGLI